MLEEQAAAGASETLTSLDELLGSDARERILQVRRGLRDLAAMLSRAPAQHGDGEAFELQPAPPPARKAKPAPKHVAPRHAKAVVKAATYYNDPAKLLEASEELGIGMPGIDVSKLSEGELLQTRGW